MKCQYQRILPALAAGLIILFATQAECLGQSAQSIHFTYVPGPGMPSWTQSDRTAPPVAHTFYVSKQTGACPIGGFVTECADEGRVANISITVNGPLIVNPTSISLTGPPCPVYDSNGYRYPAQPAVPVCQSYTGSIEPAFIPEPGTSVSASITGRDDGHWTTCSTGETHAYDDTTIQFNIKSLLLELSESDMSLDSGQVVTINANKVYPPELEVNWSVSGTGLEIVTSTAKSATLLFTANTEIILKAIITAGCASFFQQVSIKRKPKLCGGKPVGPDEKCVTCKGKQFVRPKTEVNTGCCRVFDQGAFTLVAFNADNFKCFPCGNREFIRPKNENTGCCLTGNGAVAFDKDVEKCYPCGNRKYVSPLNERTGCCLGVVVVENNRRVVRSFPYDMDKDTCFQCGRWNQLLPKAGNPACCRRTRNGDVPYNDDTHQCKLCNGLNMVLRDDEECPPVRR